MTLSEFLDKYQSPTTGQFLDLPPENITAGKLREFAEDIVALFPIETLIYDSGLDLQTVPNAKKRRYHIKPAEIPATGAIGFYYDYGATTIDYPKAGGDVFEIFFRAKTTTTVKFETFKYDYFHAPIPVQAGKYYKMTVEMIDNDGYGTNNPYVWASLQEIAEPASN